MIGGFVIPLDHTHWFTHQNENVVRKLSNKRMANGCVELQLKLY
jgi:hypothetical protein